MRGKPALRAHTINKLIAMTATVAMLALLFALSLTAVAGAEETTPWFKESVNIETKVVAGAPCTEVAEKGKGEKNVGGQASAVFDDNNDGIPDIALVNGSNNFYIDQGKRNANGEVEYAKEATRYPLNQAGELNSRGEQVSSRAKALGLDDFTRSGKLGLFVGNAGQGTLSLVQPRNLAEAYSPSNLNKKNLCQTNKRRIWTSNGNGTFTNNSSLGEESEGVTRTPLFADFSGDGRQDQLDLNAPYYGVWWGNSPAPSSLHPGEPNGAFGKNILNEAVVNEQGEPEPELFQEQYGRGDIDIKGAIVRDLTNNGKPDVVASAYADQWDGVNEEPYGIAHKEGGEVDLNHPGENIPDGGWQGAWKHGLLALRNISTPGHIKFVNESATAFPEEGLGYGDKMAAYSTIPVDLNHDGKLDLVAIGIRDFTGVGTLQFKTPIIQVYKNVSTAEHMRFENVTEESGLQFMNEPEALEKITNGHYPVDLKGILEEGAAPESPDMVWEPNLSEGAAVDLANNGNPDLVLVDRQFKSANPYTGEEFYPWVFENEGNFKFRWVPPSESGMKKTARAVSYGDLFGKGREDLVMVNGSGGGQTVEDSNNVWKNELANSNSWIEIKVRSATDGMGPLGLGAKVTVYKAGTTEVLGDEEERTDFSYRSKRDALLHFGLGQIKSVDVSVEGAGLGTPVTVHNVPIDRVDTITMAPEAPTLAGGQTPSGSGQFVLAWAGPGGANPGFTYTLEQKNASDTWTTVAAGLTKPEYAFTSEASEQEGTWSYRVRATYESTQSEPSPASAAIVVDKTAPNPPTATPSRAPDYAGGGGWYKNDVEVTFSSNGDPNLADGSPGSGVNPLSFATSAAPQLFGTSGSYTACGTVEDYVGNASAGGCATVQVDATPPSLQLSCPAMVAIGSSAHATFEASDGYSGLAGGPDGTIAIDTTRSGVKTTSYTAVSNVGLETTKSCTTYVGYYVVVKGPVQKLVVRGGEADLLASSAKVSGTVTVQPGGALDIEGAAVSGGLKAKGVVLLRICGATVGGGVSVKGATGSVVIGDNDECATDKFTKSVNVADDMAGVTIAGDVFGNSLAVKENQGGVTVAEDKVAKNLTVTGNTGTIVDRPNQVSGRTKAQ
jgi:hypothetical protein